jgi:3-deoxy-7-phosphoheptulonate synthase
MLIIMQSAASPDQIERVRQVAEGLGCEARSISIEEREAITISGFDDRPNPSLFEVLPGVSQVLPNRRPLRLARRDANPEGTRIEVGPCVIGGGQLTLIAGPCAVEGEDELVEVARLLKRAGADLLRGGAYKPRSSPYDFQGLGEEGLRLLAQARDETGLPVVTEAVDERSMEMVERYADVVQIGARNMQNFALLKRAGKCSRPVFLKRGMSAGLEDLLLAAEYVLNEGNSDVILCERGIRTFSDHSRYTLDLSIVPQLHRQTHLPVFVDPSHASGIRQSVAPLARAAVAAGAEGVMVEVHPDPLHALCDGPQSLQPHEFAALAAELRALAPFIARQGEAVS